MKLHKIEGLCSIELSEGIVVCWNWRD